MAVKAHVCIGGPLDGEHATSLDFHGQWVKVDGKLDHYEDGMYKHLSDEYAQFNTAWRQATVLQRASKSKGLKAEACHVIWLHRSLMKPPVSPRLR